MVMVEADSVARHIPPVYTQEMRQAKLFNNGRSQAVRLPKEFRLSGDSVYIRKLGRMVMLIPKEESWESLAGACEQFTDDFMESRDQGVQVREDPFE